MLYSHQWNTPISSLKLHNSKVKNGSCLWNSNKMKHDVFRDMFCSLHYPRALTGSKPVTGSLHYCVTVSSNSDGLSCLDKRGPILCSLDKVLTLHTSLILSNEHFNYNDYLIFSCRLSVGMLPDYLPMLSVTLDPILRFSILMGKRL